MFRRLKTKFILMQLGIVFSLISLFFTGLVFSIYREINSYSNATMEKIYNLDLIKPLPPKDISQDSFPRFLPFIDIVTDDRGEIREIRDSEKGLDSEFIKGNREEIKRNFYARFNVALENREDLDKYSVLLQKIEEAGEERGIFKLNDRHYRFRAEKNRFIILDITLGREIILKIIIRFFKTIIPLLILIYIISWKFASLWIKPVEESFERQREFIANASHELRTPLTAIAANLEVLSHTAEKESEKWISNIQIESTRMKKLIDELLYFTRLDFGNNKRNFKNINLSKMLERYLLSKEALFYEKNLQVDWEIAPDLEIFGDAEEIEKLLGILVDNGIKYSSKILKISLKKNGDKNEFRIYNSGEGIPQEEIDKIWDRFYRGDRSRKYTGGFGLGLAIGKKITENHRGTLHVESRVKEYTQFILKLPGR
ncbi:MAG: sensor histidine kinase [Fusobacteriaceae bacterium]